MTGQRTDAAERSTLHDADQEGSCYVCGGPWKKGGASFGARVLPPLAQVCSAECAEDPKYAKPRRRRA